MARCGLKKSGAWHARIRAPLRPPRMPDVEGFDEPARLDAFLNAVRWGAVWQAAAFDAIQPQYYDLRIRKDSEA